MLSAGYIAEHTSLPEYFPQVRQLRLLQQINKISQDVTQLQEKLKDHTLIKVIELQNKKTDLLLRYLNIKDLNDAGLESQTIIISEGGIGFHSEQTHNVNDEIVLNIIFTPSYLSIYATAKVVGLRTVEPDISYYHCNFLELEDTQRQHLVAHLLKQQTLNRVTLN